MGRTEAIIALVDELVVATVIVLIIVLLGKVVGVFSDVVALVIGGIAVGVLIVIGVLSAKAQLKRPVLGVEALIGKKGRVVEALGPEGLVVIDGEYWRAVSRSGENIDVGEEIMVVGVDGLVLQVVKTGK